VTAPVLLLRKGRVRAHLICDACGQYAPAPLSPRGWCGGCEYQCTLVGQRVRAKLAEMREREGIES